MTAPPSSDVLAPPRPSSRFLLKGLVLIASLLVVGWLAESGGLRSLDEGWIDANIRGHGIDGEVLFVAVGTIALAIGLPRQVVSFLAGYAFGMIEGSALAWAATVAACVVTFSYARLFARGLIANRFGRRLQRMDAFLGQHPFSTTLLLRLLPATNNLVTTLVAGVSSVRPLPFVAASALGYVPQTVIFALLGSGVRIDPEWRISVSVLLFVLSGLLGMYLYRRIRRSRQMAEDMAALSARGPEGEDQP